MNPRFEPTDADIGPEQSGDDARPTGYESGKAATSEKTSRGYEMSGVWPESQSDASISGAEQIAPHEAVTTLMGDACADDSVAQKLHDAYRDRISQLREDGEEEGIELGEESHKDFWAFISADPRLVRGNIFLRDNGNLCAVWRDGKGTRICLQFLGFGEVQHITLKTGGSPPEDASVTRRTTFDGLKKHIEEYNLHSLLYS